MSKSATVNKIGFKPIANDGCQSLLQSTRLGSNPLLMVDVKVYYSQQEYIATFAESMNSQVQWMHSWKCFDYLSADWVLLVNAQWMYIQLRF